MPEAYKYLQVRLRVEQIRLLKWGEEIGLLEEILDQPSQTLGINQNIILDILLQIQAVFKGCLKLQAKFDKIMQPYMRLSDVPAHAPRFESSIPLTGQSAVLKYVQAKIPGSAPLERLSEPGPSIGSNFQNRFPRGNRNLLSKILKLFEKAPNPTKRLQWAAISEEKFTTLIEKPIGYNEAVESFLSRNAILELQFATHQNYMAMLQLNTNVDELKIMCSALQVSSEAQPSITSSTLSSDNTAICQLASFKAQVLSTDSTPNVKMVSLKANEVVLKTSNAVRSEAIYGGNRVWIEWKYYISDHAHGSDWNKVVELRVKTLAALLNSKDKPESFRAPECLGYYNDEFYEDGYVGFPGALFVAIRMLLE